MLTGVTTSSSQMHLLAWLKVACVHVQVLLSSAHSTSCPEPRTHSIRHCGGYVILCCAVCHFIKLFRMFDLLFASWFAWLSAALT